MQRFINDNNRKWWTLGTVCFALLMIVLDSTIVNLAIPKILVHFNASIDQLEWINNAYLLTFAVLLITFGRLGDEIGRKKMFMVGLVLFTLGSLLSGIAGSVNQLIVFRIVQGFGGAAMMPATLSIISATFAPRERGTAMGVWGAIAGVGIALGPILGGYLTDLGLGHVINAWLHVTQYWRFIFFINVPIGVVAFLMAMGVIRESKDREQQHCFDILGIVLSAFSIFFLTFAFIEGEKYGWLHTQKMFTFFGHALHVGSYSIIPFLFVLFVLFGIFFVLRERHVSVDPLVDTKLFQSRNFSAGNITVVILSFGMMGSFFLLPLFLQAILGFSAIKTGTVLLPLAFALMVAAPIAGKISERVGGKWLIVVGMFVMAAGTFWLGHFTLSTTVPQLLAPFLIIGIGMGMTQAPLTYTTLLDILPEEAGGASGVFTTTRQIGSVMGIAILGAILQAALAHDIGTHINTIQDLPQSAKSAITAFAKNTGALSSVEGQQQVQSILLRSFAPAIQPQTPADVIAAQQTLSAKLQQVGTEIAVATKQSFTDSINLTVRISSLIALIGALSAFVFRNRRPSRDEAETPSTVPETTG